MKKSLIKSFFSSGLQAIAVQVLGVLFIAIVAKVLPKGEFGMIQTANAIAMFVTTALSFGMEQVVVRRIAASSSSDWAAAAFLFHNFIGSIVAFAIILFISFIYPDPNSAIYYLPLFFAAQAIVFLVTPLKQFLNAKHMFTPYGVIAVLSNLFKIGLAIILYKRAYLNISTAGSILLICATIELIGLLIYIRAKTSFKLSFKFVAYKKLLKESAPQYMATLFDSSLSRLDIILLGLIGTYIASADYGFAYRAYEMARLPIVIVAPVILNVFARMMNSKLSEEQKSLVKNVYNIEIFAAMLIPLILNIIWSPLLNLVFDDKYGSSNSVIFMLLSICIPLHFFINLMWTISFSAKKYKKIATITMLSAVLNLVLNICLIPYYGGLGAAVAYLITTLFQAGGYYIVVNKHLINIPLYTLFRFMIVAAGVYYGIKYLHLNFIVELLITITLYIGICFGARWVTIGNLKTLKQYLKK